MHVLIIPSAFPGPYNPYAGIFYQEMALALHHSGVKIGVIAPDIRPVKSVFSLNQWKEFGHEYAYELLPGLMVCRKTAINLLPFRKHFNKWVFNHYAEKLYVQYVERCGNPDLVHAHTTLWAGWATLQISRKHQIPYVITEHSSAFLKNSLSKTEIQLHRQVYGSAKKICAVSKAISKAMKQKAGFESIMIPNFIYMKNYRVQKKPMTPQKIFSIGNLLKDKGFGDLLHAFSRMLEVDNRLQLVIIGQGPEKANLLHLSQKLGVMGQVEFTGALSPEQTREKLSQAHIYVSASHFETFGVSIVEAMACGIPVVATRCGGPEETVVHQVGILCDKQSPQSLFEAILYVYKNYSQYSPEQIRAYVEANYSSDAVIQRQVNIYHQAIGNT